MTTDTLHRPTTLAGMIGQTETIARMQIAVGGARTRGTKVPHILLSGPAGHGKTTMARIVAEETGAGLTVTNGGVLRKAGDLAGILCAAEDGEVIFIDEIHALPTAVVEVLYECLEDGTLSVIIGKGAGARAISMALPEIVVVGATTKPGALSAPLRDRFGVHLTMQPYTADELARIASGAWDRAGVTWTPAAAAVVGSRAKGVPRLALHLAARVLDCSALTGEPIDDVLTLRAMKAFGIAAGGIDEIDRRILEALVVTFGGAAVGLDALAAALDLDVKTIQAEHEPALTRAGLLMRTASGRVATPAAHEMVRGWAA